MKKENNPVWNSKKVKCGYCEKDILLPKAKISKSEHHFCSRICFIKWVRESNLNVGEKHPRWKPKVVKICENCKKPFAVKPSHTHRARFCSRKCKDEWQHHHWRGENHPHWKGGYRKWYGVNWKEQRKKALERDNYTCQKCGKKTKLAVHHIVPFREFGKERAEEANKLENLITLCTTCHRN